MAVCSLFETWIKSTSSLLVRFLFNKQKFSNKWLLGDKEFLFSCLIQAQLTHEILSWTL